MVDASIGKAHKVASPLAGRRLVPRFARLLPALCPSTASASPPGASQAQAMLDPEIRSDRAMKCFYSFSFSYGHTGDNSLRALAPRPGITFFLH